MNTYLEEVQNKRPDWLDDKRLSDCQGLIEKIRQTRLESAFRSLDDNELLSQWFRLNPVAHHLDFSSQTVGIGTSTEIDSHTNELLDRVLRSLCPWKKGPFDLFGHKIDAEWRSDWKWQRIESSLGNIEGANIADIGCNNGYFMYRLLAHNPKLVMGFEPVVKNWQQFQLFNSSARQARLHFELLGAEHMSFFPKYFDLILCLGILYHHTDPVGLLREMRQALAPGGKLIIDCQGIPGEENLCLVPEKKYANASGIWFLPTLPALQTWVRRAGFQHNRIIFSAPLSCEEQRRTEWADISSLEEALDPNDASKTIEGYPAPWRFYLEVKA